jgi:glycosyltransferase involved in cell wall biosynthesis/predicted SAM-dependent methyltransferase
MKLLNLGCGTRHHPAWINVDLKSTGPGVIPCDLRQGLPFTDNSVDVVYHSHLLEHFSKAFAPVFLRDCFRVLKTGGIIRVVTPDLEQIVRVYLRILEELEGGSKEIQERYNWIILELLDQMVRNQSGGEIFKYWSQDPLPAADFVLERMGSELLDNLSNPQIIDGSESDSPQDSYQETSVEALKVGEFRLSGEVHQWMYDRHSLKVLLQEVGFKDVKVCQADESAIPNFDSYLLDIEEDGSPFKPVSLYTEARNAGGDPIQFVSKESTSAVALDAEIDRVAELSEVLPKSTQSLLHEIREREIKLVELRRDRDTAVEEIHKRDTQLAEVRQDRDTAVEEIHKRDAELAELHQEKDLALQQIVERDHQLAQIRRTLPLVTVVTPALNCEKWIEICINSVLSQDYPNIEHIIVDGGSTDGTLEICRRYPHLIVHSGKDRGQSHAINKGFAMAQGDILAWLCADDEYEPGAVSAAVEGIISGHNVVMGFSRFIDAEGNVISDHPANATTHYNYDMFLRFWKHSTISQPATFWTRNMWETCGPLRENLYYAMDYDLWLRMSQKCRFQRVNAYTARYRIHPEAKCFADNYSPRIELIEVSRSYWPPKWKLGYWRLCLRYHLSRNEITQHYIDGTELLKASADCLDNSQRVRAIFLFVKAHYKHLATPYLPDYKMMRNRILKDGVGPAWFWRLGKKSWDALRRKDQ